MISRDEDSSKSNETLTNEATPAARAFTGADVAELLQERGWLAGKDTTVEVSEWCERAARMLGGHVHHRADLGELLALIFSYDAAAVLQEVESHAVLARYGAREVVRNIALQLLDGQALDSERLKQLVDRLKETSDLRSRDLFLPIRLALAGKSGSGELDRVVLLLDEAARLPFAVPVKSAKTRILEFCAAMD